MGRITTPSILLLLALLLLHSNSLVQAWRGDDSTSADDSSEDGGAGRLGSTTTSSTATTNRAGSCEACSNKGTWRCDNLHNDATPWCYQSKNPKLKKWLKKGFCIQRCAELGLPHPLHQNCCIDDDSDSNVDADDTNDNDEGDSTPRVDACTQCTDKVSSGMARRGIACADINPADLGKRCLRYQRWFDQGWKDWDLCRKTCSDGGYQIT